MALDREIPDSEDEAMALDREIPDSEDEAKDVPGLPSPVIDSMPSTLDPLAAAHPSDPTSTNHATTTSSGFADPSFFQAEFDMQQEAAAAYDSATDGVLQGVVDDIVSAAVAGLDSLPAADVDLTSSSAPDPARSGGEVGTGQTGAINSTIQSAEEDEGRVGLATSAATPAASGQDPAHQLEPPGGNAQRAGRATATPTGSDPGTVDLLGLPQGNNRRTGRVTATPAESDQAPTEPLGLPQDKRRRRRGATATAAKPGPDAAGQLGLAQGQGPQPSIEISSTELASAVPSEFAVELDSMTRSQRRQYLSLVQASSGSKPGVNSRPGPPSSTRSKSSGTTTVPNTMPPPAPASSVDELQQVEPAELKPANSRRSTPTTELGNGTTSKQDNKQDRVANLAGLEDKGPAGPRRSGRHSITAAVADHDEVDELDGPDEINNTQTGMQRRVSSRRVEGGGSLVLPESQPHAGTEAKKKRGRPKKRPSTEGVTAHGDLTSDANQAANADSVAGEAADVPPEPGPPAKKRRGRPPRKSGKPANAVGDMAVLEAAVADPATPAESITEESQAQIESSRMEEEASKEPGRQEVKSEEPSQEEAESRGPGQMAVKSRESNQKDSSQKDLNQKDTEPEDVKKKDMEPEDAKKDTKSEDTKKDPPKGSVKKAGKLASAEPAIRVGLSKKAKIPSLLKCIKR